MDKERAGGTAVPDRMRIATYNVNGINGRLPVLLRWLDLAQPDIVCLQELKAPQEKFPEAAVRDAGYQAIWHGQSRWNGVALLSRTGDIHETRRGLPGNPDAASRTTAAFPPDRGICKGVSCPGSTISDIEDP